MSTSGLHVMLFDVHFDGVFYFDPLRYENGVVFHLRVSKDKKYFFDGLTEYLKEQLETTFYDMFFRLLGCELEKGLKIVESNADLEPMYEFCEAYGKLEMYLAHIPQNLYEYYYTNLVFEESVNEEASKLRIQGIKRYDAGNLSYDKLVSWAEEEAQKLKTPPKPRTVSRKHWDSVSPHKIRSVNLENVVVASSDVVHDDIGPSEHVHDENGPSEHLHDNNGPSEHVHDDNVPSVQDEDDLPRKFVDKGKDVMIDEDRPIHARKPMDRNKGIAIEENMNPSGRADSSSDSDAEIPDFSMLYEDTESELSDRSVDYLSEGEDELIELRRRNFEAKRAPKVKKQATEPQGVEGSSRQNKWDGIGENETVLEHEEFLGDLMRKLKGCDDAVGLTDPFKMVETNVERYPVYDADTHWKMQKPTVGEKFADVGQLKECITYYALANGFSLWFERSGTKKVVARCGLRPEKIKDPKKGKQSKYNRYPTDRDEGSKCPWRCYGKRMRTEKSFQVVSLNDEHTCVRDFKFGSLINYKWIAKHFGPKIRMNPDIKLHQIAQLVMKKYKCIVSPSVCRRAKNWATHEGENTMADHYGYIRSYAKAILDTNEGSTIRVGVTVNPDDAHYFDRFYVCFNGLKEGWKKGCRRVIALDGCFLKKPNVGEFLSAIGRDANNHIFPVAWAVVNVENKENWSWFLELLGQDLELPTGSGLTLMSDQHKGLIEVVKDIMPHAEHRQCARHIYEGFRKTYSGVEFRDLFWAASKASYPGRFNKIMEKIKIANPNAYDYLIKKDPKTWSRAYFHIGNNCEAVENGFSECFNAVILTVRDKPLITMLESMRVIVMERMNIMRKMLAKWTDDIFPNIQKRLELMKDQHRYYRDLH